MRKSWDALLTPFLSPRDLSKKRWYLDHVGQVAFSSEENADD